MGHLTKRGWSAKTPLITQAEANIFKERCNESHHQQWKADVYRWSSGQQRPLAYDIPVSGGTLVMDSGDLIRRQLTLEVGGMGEWEALDSDGALAPFGQVLELFLRIDLRGGGWTPWLKVFEGPIRENIFERPSLITTVECADRGSSLHEYLHIKKKGYGDNTLVEALDLMASAALPDAVYDIDASPSAHDAEVTSYIAEAGQSRLEAANELAGKHGHEAFFDWNGDMVIRRDVTDEDDNNWNPSEAGPDIGDVNRPVAVFRDEEGGNLLGITTSLSREGAVNGVAINLHALRRTNRKANDDDEEEIEIHWHTLAEATGTVAWGNKFGRIPLVESKDVHKLTDTMKSRQTKRAQRLLKRRRGLLKFHDFDSLPMPWVEPDDRVSITVNGITENHYIQRVEIDLEGGPMHCRTRVLATPFPTEAEEP